MEQRAGSHLQKEKSQIKVQQETKRKGSIKQNNSGEEARIRGELEAEIERELEGELKDEIYRLALRLGHLYKHQRDNKHKEKAVSEVNISIKMKEGTKVEFKEMKNNPHYLHLHNKHLNENNNNNKVSTSKYGTKKFDWTKSLRAGPPKPRLQVAQNTLEAQKQYPRFRGQFIKGNKVVTIA